MKKTVLTAIALSAVMTASVIAGCNKAGETTAATDTSATETSAETSETSESSAEESETETETEPDVTDDSDDTDDTIDILDIDGDEFTEGSYKVVIGNGEVRLGNKYDALKDKLGSETAPSDKDASIDGTVYHYSGADITVDNNGVVTAIVLSEMGDAAFEREIKPGSDPTRLYVLLGNPTSTEGGNYTYDLAEEVYVFKTAGGKITAIEARMVEDADDNW